jgi:type III pantothenate kinase
MELVIDVGNTRTKIGIFVNNGIQKVDRFDSFVEAVKYVNNLEWNASIISTTQPIGNDELKGINRFEKVLLLDENTSVPIINEYKTPKTLGKDRLAAVVGAQFLFPQKNCMVIDAGTCITYDVINAEGRYIGGNISLGFRLRSRALNHFTGALPLVEPHVSDIIVGRNTIEAINSGIFNGLVHEVNGVIQSYKTLYSELKVLLCGGEASYLVNHINNEIFANQNLVLLGLHKILLHNDR